MYKDASTLPEYAIWYQHDKRCMCTHCCGKSDEILAFLREHADDEEFGEEGPTTSQVIAGVRANGSEYSEEQLRAGLQVLHQMGKVIYTTTAGDHIRLKPTDRDEQ